MTFLIKSSLVVSIELKGLFKKNYKILNLLLNLVLFSNKF